MVDQFRMVRLFAVSVVCFLDGTTKRPYIWIVLALSVYVVPCFYGIEHNPTHWALLRVTAEFVGGCFLFQIYRRGWKCPLPPWTSGALALVICAVCTYFDVTRACSLPFFALLIWGLAVNTEGCLAGPVAVYGGQVSYSLYMTHGLCQIFLNRALPAGHFVTSSVAIRAGLVVFYLFLIVVAAVLTYHYVETPARHWLNRSEKGTVRVKEISVPPPLEEEQSAEA